MRISFKHNNKLFGQLFKAINIALIAFGIITFVIYVSILGINGSDGAKDCGIVFLSLFAFFAVFNAIIIFITFRTNNCLIADIKKYIIEEKYDMAIEHLQTIAGKRILLSSTNQIILFYLGYIELLKDNLEDAIYYLTQFNIKKQTIINSHCLATTIFLLYMVFICKKDEKSIKYINPLYQEKKASLIKATNSDQEITTMFNAIDSFNNNNIKECISILKRCRCMKIPFIQRFVVENSVENE